MAFPERALSEPRAIDFLLKEGWLWRLNGGPTIHLIPPRPGPLARTYCGEPLRANGDIPDTLFGTAACRRCAKRAGLA